MSVAELYRNRGVNPLAVQGGRYRLQPDANTIGLWWLSEGWGLGLFDKSTTPHHGILGTGATGNINAPGWNALGPWGSGLTFDGSNDYAVLPAGCSIGTNNLTVEVVMLHAAVDLAVYTELMVGNDYTASNGRWLFGLRSNSDATYKGKMCFFVYSTADRLSYGNSRCDDGLAHYLVATLDRSTNLVSYFKDGIADGTTTLTISTTSLVDVLLFGGAPVANAYWYNGKLFLVRISNIARTTASILANAKCMGFA